MQFTFTIYFGNNKYIHDNADSRVVTHGNTKTAQRGSTYDERTGKPDKG